MSLSWLVWYVLLLYSVSTIMNLFKRDVSRGDIIIALFAFLPVIIMCILVLRVLSEVGVILG